MFHTVLLHTIRSKPTLESDQAYLTFNSHSFTIKRETSFFFVIEQVAKQMNIEKIKEKSLDFHHNISFHRILLLVEFLRCHKYIINYQMNYQTI
jgi:hypothetical protein